MVWRSIKFSAVAYRQTHRGPIGPGFWMGPGAAICASGLRQPAGTDNLGSKLVECVPGGDDFWGTSFAESVALIGYVRRGSHMGGGLSKSPEFICLGRFAFANDLGARLDLTRQCS